jgi:integrase
MSKISFTAARISSFQCPEGKGQALFWDAKTPGLGLRITSGGSRSYVFESRVFGRTIRITIGSSDAWDLGQARTEAARLKVQIDQGVDPRLDRVAKVEAARAGARAASRQAATLGGAWDVYVASRRPYWSVRHHQDHVNHAAPGGEIKKRGTGVTQAGPIAALRAQRLTELSGAKVGSWLSEQAANRPTVSALSYRLLRGFIRWADESEEYRGLIPSDAYKARSVKDALPKIGAKHGDVLQREQLQSWFAAVRSLENGVASAYLQALLLTGARREELAVLRWEDVDFKWNTLVLDDKVEGTGGRTIPLTRYLSKLFTALKQENATPPPARRLQRWLKEGKTYGGPSPWVFASPTAASGYLAEPRSAHQRALTAGGLPHVTIHGLRRSFGTLSEWCEVPVGVVAQIQGHKPSAIAEKHYRRRPIDLLRKWHQEIEDWILCEAKISAVEISEN